MCRSLKKSNYQLYQLFYHRGKSPLWHSYQSVLSLFWHNSLFLSFLRGNFYHGVAFFMFWQGYDWHLKSLSNNQPFSNMEQHANTSDTTGLQQHSWNRSWNELVREGEGIFRYQQYRCSLNVWSDMTWLFSTFPFVCYEIALCQKCVGGNWHWFSSSVICGSVFLSFKIKYAGTQWTRRVSRSV